MENQRLYMIQGTGNDAVGLVGKITAPIASAGGNVVDLRQDVLHGLFTIFMVVDLTGNPLRLEELTALVGRIAEDTGLRLSVDTYSPVGRKPEKKNLLMILIGKDQPGIIAASSAMLGRYNANIEFSQTIGREGVFLMELLTDISQCSIPLVNLRQTVTADMAAMGINVIFQENDVFNKKKRAILFDISASLISRAVGAEILRQTGIAESALATAFPADSPGQALRSAAARLEGFPLEVIDQLLGEIKPTRGSAELIQTLKIMGYKVALAAGCLSIFTERLKRTLDLDYCFGIPAQIDDDARSLSGELGAAAGVPRDVGALVNRIAAAESIGREDITVIHDDGRDETPGVRIDFGIGKLLDLFNNRVISREALIGLLGSWGIPRQ